MNFYEVIKTRRSIRGYRPDPVPDESLKRIAEAVQMAPTACNRQPFRLLLIRNEEKRMNVIGTTRWEFLKQAPVLAVMLVNDTEAWHRFEGESAAVIDGSIAMEHFMLAATAEGLSSCWICAFERAAVDRVLNLSAPFRSFALAPLGYAAEAPCPFVRKKLSEIVEILD